MDAGSETRNVMRGTLVVGVARAAGYFLLYFQSVFLSWLAGAGSYGTLVLAQALCGPAAAVLLVGQDTLALRTLARLRGAGEGADIVAVAARHFVRRGAFTAAVALLAVLAVGVLR